MSVKNCPETPRQKMISMMYLVLTALLALNVSREIVNAFVLVENGLSQTIDNFSTKNQSTYDAFAKAEIENPLKVKSWREKADDVKKHTNELFDYIQKLKIEIILAADGKEAKAVHGDKIYADSIEAAENLDYASVILIGSERNGKAFELKKKLNDYRDFLISLINAKDKGLKESLINNLSTKDPPSKETEIQTWETHQFDQLPLIASITLLTKIQSDLRNAESDLINYLFKQIDESSFKFNKLEAIVKQKSNFIFTDGTYEAQVFLAASDTTQKPIIYIGRYDSTKLEDGTYDYNMIGVKGRDYDTLPIINGKGYYKRSAGSSNQEIKWGGLIYYKTPGGGENHYPFKGEYQVADIGLVVSPTKMNVFYIGVDNPVDISVPGVPSENISATMSNGVINKDPKGGWIVRPTNPDLKGNNTSINVVATIDGKKKDMGKKNFRVKNVPDPIAKVGGQISGFITKNNLLAQNGVEAKMENFDFEMSFLVTEFTMSTIIKGFTQEKQSKSNKFTDQQYELMKGLRRGDKVYFEDIKARGPDKITRPLQTLVFRIQ